MPVFSFSKIRSAFLVLAMLSLCACTPTNSLLSNNANTAPAATNQNNSSVIEQNQNTNQNAVVFSLPLSRALERVTKKKFGTKVSPTDSPVSPERFSGYHTGVDFEIFPAEESTDVSVYATCSGELLQKRTATGYGGLVVQHCVLEKEDVTVVYGHLKLSSVEEKAGQVLTAGEKLGVLGNGFSQETDGERKHLHLGIHRGSVINVRGYVTQQTQLNDWLDPLLYWP